MDALDAEIAKRRKEREEALNRASALETEIRFLEYAAKLRPLGQAADSLTKGLEAIGLSTLNGPLGLSVERRGGKAPGTISNAWRSILEARYQASDRSQFHDFLAEAQRQRVSTNPAAVRDRVRALEAMGYLVGDSQNGYFVTKQAVDRFGFEKASAPELSPEPLESLDTGDSTDDEHRRATEEETVS